MGNKTSYKINKCFRKIEMASTILYVNVETITKENGKNPGMLNLYANGINN